MGAGDGSGGRRGLVWNRRWGGGVETWGVCGGYADEVVAVG